MKLKSKPDLKAKLAAAVTRWEKMTPAEKAAMRKAQRESYVRGEASWPKSKFKESYEDYCDD